MKSTFTSLTFARLPMTAAVMAAAFLMSSPVEAKDRKKKDKDRHSDHGRRDRRDREQEHDHHHVETRSCSCHDHHHGHMWHCSHNHRDYLCPGHD